MSLVKAYLMDMASTAQTQRAPLAIYPAELERLRSQWSDEQIDAYVRSMGFDGFSVIPLRITPTA